MVGPDGKRLKAFGNRKSAGSTWLSFPPALLTLCRSTPRGAGHFCNLETRTGRFRYAFGFQKTDAEDFDAEKYGDFKAAIEAVNEAYNVSLPTHLAMGSNTEGIPITTCVPPVKEKWEDFKKRWLESAKKAAVRAATSAAKEKKLSKEEIKKAGDKAAKKVEFDEVTAREDFRDDLIEKMSDDDNKFLRAKNFSIINAEVLVINFDMRNNQKIERKIAGRDLEQLEAWKKVLADDVEEMEYLKLIEEQLLKSYDSGNPLKFNDELVINDSSGTPMTLQAALSEVEWRGALVTPTIKLRPIDFKKIESVQVITPVDLAAIQVEVNGKQGSNQPIGSSIGCFGPPSPPKRTLSAVPAPPPAAKRSKLELQESE